MACVVSLLTGGGGHGRDVEVEGQEGVVEGEVYYGGVGDCASRKETRMWSMADHESVSSDVVERV